MGIRAYLPAMDFSNRTKFYPAERFPYDAKHNQYICPQGQVLSLSSRRNSEQVYVYAADASVCNSCPVKTECTDSQIGEAKQFHRLRQFRLRGLMKVNIEGVLIATDQNLKRLIKAKADEILSFFKSVYLFVKLPQNSYFFNRLLPYAK